MPRRRARRKRIGVEFSKGHRHQLETGQYYPIIEGYGPDLNDEILKIMQRDWIENRSQLLSEWIEKKPGTRPWAWWFFDAPAMRRCWKYDTVQDSIDGKIGKRLDLEKILVELPDWARTPKKRNYFGMLAITPGLHGYESEEVFLKRHKLLRTKELSRSF